nr:MAG TPA: hypothetical protein [Caudoviricetes sp.]
MAFIINEQKMVEDTTFQFENRFKSPTARFIDTTPVFVTYYHVDVDNTTVDEGFLDVASVIGNRSPIRFKKIEKFPLYGMDQIVLNIAEDDQGLDSTWDGDGIVLPKTIKPVPNDFFIIPTLKDYYIFRVTNIQYDTVMPDNYYKIEFKLEYIDSTKLEEIEKQVLDEHVCVLENIGTETNCIIEKSSYNKIKEIEKMYAEIKELYMAMFYNDRHNVFLCEIEDGKLLYDPLQTYFINIHKLFNDKNDLSTIMLTDQYDDPKRKYKYAKSVYKFLETKDMKLLSMFKYTTRPGTSIRESSFRKWHDRNIEVLDTPMVIPDDSKSIFSQEYMEAIRLNAPVESDYAELIQRYVRGERLTIKDINMELDTELIYLNNSIEVFFFTPFIMYIIRKIIEAELHVEIAA